MKEIRILLGEQIRALRALRNLSQEELAERANVSHNYIGSVERGEKNCSIIVLSRIAAGLEIPVNELVTFPGIGDDGEKIRDAVLKEISGAPMEEVRLISRLLLDLKAIRLKIKAKKSG